MDSFYFLRHGQTAANANWLMCGGKWDIPINEEGVAQAEATAKELAKHVPVLGSLLVSPLIRARQTADIVLRHYQCPVFEVPELREWDLGHWDRRPFEEVKHEFLGDGEPIGGETRQELRTRVQTALDIAKGSPGPALLVAHGGVWVSILEIFGLERNRLENGCAKKFTRKNGVWVASDLCPE